MIEERMLIEGDTFEEEGRTEKEGEPFLKSFRPVKKKVVVKENQKRPKLRFPSRLKESSVLLK